jgi:beta-lactamase regulating signal transducer with metallopeptidase domain
MTTSLKVGIWIFGLFVLAVVIHTIFARRESERLHRLAQSDRERRQRRLQS